MNILIRILAISPLALLHVLGWVLGWLVFLGSASYRKRFLANVQQAALPWAHVRAAVGQSGMLVAELPRLWLGAPVPVHWQAGELIEQALAQGQGIMFLTPHLGSFEVAARSYAQRWGKEHQPITVLYRPARQAWLQAIVKQARHRPGLQAAPTTLAGVRQLVRALRGGQAVGLLPDQVPPDGLGVWAPFFGRPAYTMTLPARLAAIPGVAVLLVWCERLPWGRGYCAHVQALPAPLPTSPEAAAAQVNMLMEQVVLQAPSQYLWGYARYKQPAAHAHVLMTTQETT